jgi:hypothetical protein
VTVGAVLGEQNGSTYVVIDPERVRRALVCKQLTQRQVATGARISPDTVSKMVRGHRVHFRKAAEVIRFLDSQPDFPGFAEYVSCG